MVLGLVSAAPCSSASMQRVVVLVIQQRLLDDVVPLFELGPAADPVISGSGCSWFLRCGEVIDYFFKCI